MVVSLNSDLSNLLIEMHPPSPLRRARKPIHIFRNRHALALAFLDDSNVAISMRLDPSDYADVRADIADPCKN